MCGSRSEFTTEAAARYLARLASHWKHRFAVTREADVARIEFGGSTCLLEAFQDKLTISVTTENADEIGELEEVVAEHLQRVGQIENLHLTWNRLS